LSPKAEAPDSVVSYVLIGGVSLSVAVEVLGIAMYYTQTGGFASGYTPDLQVSGTNFFTYVFDLFVSLASFKATRIMALGVILLMLTAYARSFVTFLHFAFSRNPKYATMSLILLILLTLTLLTY